MAGSNGTTSVLANDTYNGAAATTSNVNLTQVSTTNLGVALNTTTSMIEVAAGTPAGTYTVSYSICDKVNPTTNCQQATATVTVPAPAIVANTETITGVNSTGGTSATSVLANDTYNGQPATVGSTGNVTLTPGTMPTAVTMNPDGTLTVAPNTPAGTYDITYTICDKVNTSNCQTVTSQITIDAPTVVATDDTETIAAGENSTTSVLANDTYNGQPATIGATGNVKLTQVSTTNTGVTLNTTTGMIEVAPGTLPGS